MKPPQIIKQLPDYSDQLHNLQKEVKKSKVFFVDSNFKPLTVSRDRIAKSQNPICYSNHMEHLPRPGDEIMIGSQEVYCVARVLHRFSGVRSGVQEIYIVLK